jgi:hypothetical protein
VEAEVGDVDLMEVRIVGSAGLVEALFDSARVDDDTLHITGPGIPIPHPGSATQIVESRGGGTVFAVQGGSMHLHEGGTTPPSRRNDRGSHEEVEIFIVMPSALQASDTH